MANDAKKIQAIIARLASDHDGEVIAAARVLKRMAEAKKLKLWEFVTIVAEPRPATHAYDGTSATEDPFEWARQRAREAREWAEREQRRKDSEWERAKQAYDDFNRRWGKKGNWSKLRDELAQRISDKGSDHLTTWEKEFLLDIFQRDNLSPRQLEIVKRIAYEKYGIYKHDFK